MTSKFLQRVDATGFALTLATAAAWGYFYGWQPGASVAVGGAIALLNLVILRQVLGTVVSRLASGQGQPPTLLLLYGLKFGAMALLIFALVTLGRIDTLALAVGISIAPAAIFIEWVRWSFGRAPSTPSESGAQ